MRGQGKNVGVSRDGGVNTGVGGEGVEAVEDMEHSLNVPVVRRWV